jgi:FtsZ-interacting cell division protein YlmF
MFDDFNDDKENIGAQSPKSPSTSTDNTVDLFPALADKRMTPINTIRPPVHTKQGTQISIFNPITFDEALDIVECLRGRAATTITLENMKKVDAHRLVDFVAGASSALQGNFHKLSEQVYLFCPANIKISVPGKVTTKTGSFGETNQSLDFLYPSDMQSIKTWPSSARFTN